MKQYQNLLQDIIDNGVWKNPAREGMPRTKSIFSRQLRFNLQDGFPAITIKKLYWRGVVGELLFFLSKNTSIEYLKNNNINIWNKDCERYDKESNSLLGKIYPYQWRNWGGELSNTTRDLAPFKYGTEITTFVENEVIKSNGYGEFVIIKEFTDYRAEIQFLYTGFKTVVRKDKITSKSVYDPYYPKQRGIACLGLPQGNSTLLDKLKVIWRGIIDRCYNENNDNYAYYGARGVRVSNRWKCFEYFVEDVQKLIGWEDKYNNWSKFELDKDSVGNGLLYSVSTCIWLDKSINSKLSKVKNRYTVTKEGKVETFVNPVDFIDKFKVSQGNFCSMLRGERKTCSGWSLVSVEQMSDNGFDQIQYLINNIITKPDSRYHIVTAWNPTDFLQYPDRSALPACHMVFQCYVRNVIDSNNVDRTFLDLDVTIRSSDVFLGLPFNIASYALLQNIIADLTGLTPGELVVNTKDTHIYEDHKEQVEEAIYREPKKLPWLDMTTHYYNQVKLFRDGLITLDEFFNSINIEDFILKNYESHEAIKANLSVGI